MKTIPTSKLNSQYYWRALVSALTFVLCLFQYSAAIANPLDDGVIEADLMTSPEFERAENPGGYLYVPAASLSATGQSGYATTEGFYQHLYDTSIANLGAATYVPVSVDDINFVIPTYNNPAHVGDAFVQSRYVRSQVRELLGRHLINADDPAYANEAQQLATLYHNAYNYALTSKLLYGTRLTLARDASTINMIWPEIRNIHGQNVVVPVLYLTASTVANRRVSEHEVFFGGNVTFNSISLSDVNIKAGRQTFINAVHDLTADGAKILGSGDLSLVAGGNINLLSSEIRNKGELQLGADGNISLKSSTINSNGSITISAQNLTAQTVVQRVEYGNGHQGYRYGQITSINSANGDVTVHTGNDIILQGVRVSAGDGITFGAGGNIYIGSVALNDSFTGRDGNWKVQSSNVDYLVSSLSAEETIELMAGGHITLDAAQIASDEGHIEILAGQGITVEDEMAEHRNYKKGKFGKKKKEITDYQTVAIRSILDAGKGVRLHTDFGDITLKATEITSAEGAHVGASNGKVNLLLSKELDHYSYVSTYNGTFKIKNRNEGHYIETAIPNAIVGGLKVEAAYGLNVEYPGDKNLSLDEQIDKLSMMQGFEWMKDVRNDPNVNWVEAQLAYETWKENNTSLTPAFAALITVVVACVTGGIGLVGLMTTAAGGSAVLGGALAAGITTMATQTTIALASGNIRSMSDMVEFQTSSETMKAQASAMITAGAVASVNSYFETGNFFDMKKGTDAAQAADTVVSTAAGEFTVTGNELADQVVQAVVNTTVKLGVNTLVYGGDFEDSFKQTLTQSLMQDAINQLGAFMAQKIGAAFDHNGDPITNFDTAMKYILHAGAGCVVGVASANVNQDQSSSDGCSYGAVGEVTGEIVATVYRERTADEVQASEQKIQGLVDGEVEYTKELRDGEAMSDQQIVEHLNRQDQIDYYQDQIDQLRATGVDVARFSAALGAFMVGADAAGVNTAANTGGIAAENNALFLLAIPVLIKVGDIVITGYDIYQAYKEIDKAYREGREDDGNRLLADFLKDAAGEKLLGMLFPGGSIANKIGDNADEIAKAVQAVKDAGGKSLDGLMNALGAKEGLAGDVARYLRGKKSKDEVDIPLSIPTVDRRVEVAELFDPTSSRSGIQIGDRSFIPVPNNGNAIIFDGATESEVKKYFLELADEVQLPIARPIPRKTTTLGEQGVLYTVKTPEGNFNLRNFARSEQQTGPAWTIEIPGSVAGRTYDPEIKFLRESP